MSNLFDRPCFPVTLPDGRTCSVQRVGGSQHAEAMRNALVESSESQITDLTDGNVKYWATLCYYGIADPKPESVEQVAAALSTTDLRFVAERIEYRSDLRDDPDKKPDEPAWDAKLEEAPVEGGEVPGDPLVDEFPASEHDAGGAVGDDAASVRDVSLPAESVGGGVGGGSPVHGGEADSATGASEAADD